MARCPGDCLDLDGVGHIVPAGGARPDLGGGVRSLYLEESLEAIVTTTMESLHATGAALVLEDGKIAWPEGRPGAHAVRFPLRWKRRQIGELVCDRDTPFSVDDEALLEAIATTPPSRSSTGAP